MRTRNQHGRAISRDVIFIFGAGASYGAGGILPEQPPLGVQLYSILERIYPGSWGSFPNDICEVFKENFEAGMQLVHDRFAVAIPSLMREMAVYFVQFRPYERATLYCRLIEDLKQKNLLHRTLFSTLNYECVLEFSLLNHSHTIAYFDEGSNNEIPVWKLHGSCNMFSQSIQAGPGIAYGEGIAWEGGIEAFLDANRVIQRCLVETALAPVMCLYMQGKPLSVSPAVIHAQQEKWAERVEAASMVVSIGVRPMTGDEHVWKPLAETSAPLFFIGDRIAFNKWCKESRTGPTEYTWVASSTKDT
jgi:hypothetical protein